MTNSRVLIILVSFFMVSIAYANKQPETVSDSLEIYLNKAYDYYDAYNYAESVKQGRLLLEIAYAGNNRKYIAEAYYILALNDESIEEYDRAKEKYLKALKIAEQQKDSLFIIDVYNELGNIASLYEKNYQDAEKYYLKGLEIGTRINDPEKIIFVINVCWDYLETGRHKNVEKYLKELKEFIVTDTVKLDLDLAGSKSHANYILGRYYGEENDFTAAHTYLDEAVKYAVQFNLYEHAGDAYLAGSKLYKRENADGKAYEMLTKYIEVNKKQNDLTVLKKMQIEEVKLKIQEYQRALDLSEKEKELTASIAASRSKLNKIYLIIVIVSLIFIGFIYKENLDKKKLIGNLNHTNTELREAKRRVSIAAEVKSNFVSNISHELRTPLHGVIGITSLLLAEKEISDDNKKLLQSLKFSGDYLLGLINNVLLLSKIDNDKIKILPKAFVLKDFFEHIRHSIEYSAQKHNVQVSFEIEKGIPSQIILDESILSEILINLVENAIKFAKDGNVSISVKTIENNRSYQHAWLRFAVKDDGLGIPEDQQRNIFQKFSQISSNQSIMEGTGLGLSIVKSLLMQMGSNIHLESKEGEGSVFYFDLLTNIPEEVGYEAEAAAKDQTPDYSNKRILLVEDNEINKLVIEKFLSAYHIHLDIYSDGVSGYEALQNNQYDLALLDINIPGLSGYEITRKIRRTNKKTPIVAVTASELSEIEDVAYKAGMNDILIKPFNKQKLSEILHRYLK